MAEKKVKDEYPFPGSLFTVKELDYITAAVKMIPYEVDYAKATINVPASKFDEASENLTVMHLANQFGFTVQPHVDYPDEVRSVFDPEMTLNNPNAVRLDVYEEKDQPLKRGDRFEVAREINTKVMIFGESSDKKSWIMAYIGSMKTNFHISKISADISVNSKLWIPISS